MARLQQDGENILLSDIADPVDPQDAATKAYVDANSGGGGDSITASGGLQRVADDISIVDDGVTNAKIASGAVANAQLAASAVTESKISATNVPTTGQVLSSTSGGEGFTWVDQTAGGSNTDYNNAPFGNFDEDGSIDWTFNAADDPATQGEVSITDNGVQGYTLRFRTADVDTINSVSVDLFQIGFGSPIAFATYAVADLVIADDFVDLSIINGPLDGDDILATLPADNTAMSIIVSVSQFRLPLSSLEDVNIPTPIGTHGLIYDGTNNEWVSSETVNQIADGGHIDVSTVAGVATLTFDETFDLWQKNDWVQINTGTPAFADDEILWDDATETLTVPSVNGRTLENILLSARTGMGVQIRRQQTNVDPVGFTSGFYQILSIDASLTPDQVVIQLLPDETDIFNEPAGGTFTYELVVLQFITGGTLNNLTLDGLADTNFSTAPTDTQVLSYDTTNNQWVPRDAATADLASSEIGDLGDVSGTQATNGQILSYVIQEGETEGVWTPVNEAGGAATDYNNAAYGALRNPNISYTYTTETSPVNQGEVSVAAVDSPATGFSLIFRREDVDVKFLQSVRYFQIGFGSPIAFATYAVSTISLTNNTDPLLATITLVDGPLAGNDILASLPADETALSISVSSNEFENPDLGDLPDVDFSTAPTDGQVLAYETATSTWKPVDDSSSLDLGDLDDVNTNGVADGFLIRYDGPNSNYRAHSVENTLAVYGGIISNRDGTLVTPVASGLNALAVGNDTEATGEDSVAIGVQAEASHEAAVAIGAGATAFANSSIAIGELSSTTHANSTAIGEGAGTSENNELRLGSDGTHVTVAASVAGNESDDNQLVSKRWVNNQISDASRVVSSTANAIENLTVVTSSTPWDDYRIVPGTSLVPELQVHMYEFDATESQFIFYPGFLSDAITGDGANLTTGTIPDFFEEVTDIANEAEVTNAGGTAVTSLGWKYLGHDTAIVWQAVSHVYTFNFEWIYPSANSDGTQNPPDVTSSLELVRLKPLSDNTYNMNMNATVIASSPTSFHNAGSLNPGDTESFTGSYEFAQQELADGISNVENGDVFAYRMKIRYKGNGFDGDTNVRLSITESETSNIVPQIGIRHVGRDYSLVLEDSGDLQWTDHGSAIETNLVLVENSDSGPIIPAASLGLIAGDNITITGKTISADGSALTAGNGIAITDDVISVNAPPSVSGLVVGPTGVQINTLRANGTFINSSNNNVGVALRQDLTSSGLAFGGSGTDAGLFLDLADSNSGLVRASDGLQIDPGDGITVNTTGITIDFRTETNNPLEVSGTGSAAGLSLNIDEDGPLQKTANGLDVIIENNGGLSIGSLNSGIEVLLPANSGLQKTSTGLSLNAAIGELTDVSSTVATAGQILHWNATSEEWEPTSLANDGTDLTFNAPLSVSDTDVVTLSSGNGLNVSSNNLVVEAGAGIGVNADGVFLNSGIGGLNDVNTTDKTPTEGQFLSYDNTDGEWVPVDGISDLSDLSDVSNTAPSNGQALVYNNSTSLWTPAGVGEEYVAINFNSSDSTPDIGLQARAIGIGPDTSVTGVAGNAIGWGSSAGGALGIAIGERATVSATRGIAIGTSTDSSDSSASLAEAAGQQSIAIGRAARATNTNAIAFGDDSRALTTDTTAIGASAQVTGTATGSTAIGHNATATVANTTVLGSGASHRVFAGTNELATISNEAGTNLLTTVNNDFWQTPNNGFNPAGTTQEILRYTQIGDLAIGRFDFRLASSESTAFQEGDRWTVNSSDSDMLDAFGYNVGSSAIALGNFVISEDAYNSAAMGDFWLHPSSSTSIVRLSFRVRSVIGTAPDRASYVSAQFNLAKF